MKGLLAEKIVGFAPHPSDRRLWGWVSTSNGRSAVYAFHLGLVSRLLSRHLYRIVEETLVAGAVVSEVARRHGLTLGSAAVGDARPRRNKPPWKGLSNSQAAADPE